MSTHLCTVPFLLLDFFNGDGLSVRLFRGNNILVENPTLDSTGVLINGELDMVDFLSRDVLALGVLELVVVVVILALGVEPEVTDIALVVGVNLGVVQQLALLRLMESHFGVALIDDFLNLRSHLRSVSLSLDVGRIAPVCILRSLDGRSVGSRLLLSGLLSRFLRGGSNGLLGVSRLLVVAAAGGESHGSNNAADN